MFVSLSTISCEHFLKIDFWEGLCIPKPGLVKVIAL